MIGHIQQKRLWPKYSKVFFRWVWIEAEVYIGWCELIHEEPSLGSPSLHWRLVKGSITCHSNPRGETAVLNLISVVAVVWYLPSLGGVQRDKMTRRYDRCETFFLWQWPVFIVTGFSLIIKITGVLPTRTDKIVNYWKIIHWKAFRI